ncbi:MAG: hypothetical protein AAFO99_15895, partial [Bacteroidota bacterium]
MIHSLPHSKVIRIALSALIGVFLISCGSYQQASYYDNDGIYASGDNRVSVEKPPRTAQNTQQAEDNVYSNYFGQKAQEYDEILDNEVFTDVDSYYGGVENDSLEVTNQTDYFDSNNDYQGYAGWGESPSNVNINIYYNWGYGGFGFGGFGF